MAAPANRESPLSAPAPLRAGIYLAGIERRTGIALRYLITHLNTLQRSFEFEFFDPKPKSAAEAGAPCEPDLIDRLASDGELDWAADLEPLALDFAREQRAWIVASAKDFGIRAAPPDIYIIVCTARLASGFYAVTAGKTEVLALGNWKHAMAPPSLVEFVMTLVVRVAAGWAGPKVEQSMHLATKGCLFDFNEDLGTVRLKVLNGFICSSCEQALAKSRRATLLEDLRAILGKSWLGKTEDPLTPAGICRKLGYDLYLTKGLQPSRWQSVATQLQGSLVSEVVKLAGVAALAGIAFLLGFNIRS